MNSYTDYDFHQTPEPLARDLIATLPLDPTDRLYEPSQQTCLSFLPHAY